ncbi:MAG: GGDEF domain-containing protein [Thermosynechococcaceae cyanobacterium]
MSFPFLEVFPDALVWLAADGRVLAYQTPPSDPDLIPAVVQGQPIRLFLPTRVGELFEQTLQQALQLQTQVSLEYSLAAPQGKIHYEARVIPIHREQAIAIIRNISDRKYIEDRLIYDALHDSLTGLPNRSLFLDRVEMALRRLKRFPKLFFAVLFLDLDGFKQVNDSFGHGTGDLLLMAIADILRNCVRANDTVARLGGDEFTILLDGIAHLGEARQVAERIQETMTEPLLVGSQTLISSASIGITLGTFRYGHAADILKDADTALYQAKANGKGQYAIFEP